MRLKLQMTPAQQSNRVQRTLLDRPRSDSTPVG